MIKPPPQFHRSPVKGAMRDPGRDYVSNAGDPRRQGRVDHAPQHAERGATERLVAFEDQGARVVVLLGVMVVAEISINPTGTRKEYFWSCFLPMCGTNPRPAGDLDKAKEAVEFKVREWCEAAGVCKRTGKR